MWRQSWTQPSAGAGKGPDGSAWARGSGPGGGEGSQPRMPRAGGRNHSGDRAPEALKG